jgi:ribosomal protein S12 methylthiotransferase accessory factor
MVLTMKYGWDKEKKKYPQMEIELKLPLGFPEKYRDAIIRAMDQCVVKKHILDPPEIQVSVT